MKMKFGEKYRVALESALLAVILGFAMPMVLQAEPVISNAKGTEAGRVESSKIEQGGKRGLRLSGALDKGEGLATLTFQLMPEGAEFSGLRFILRLAGKDGQEILSDEVVVDSRRFPAEKWTGMAVGLGEYFEGGDFSLEIWPEGSARAGGLAIQIDEAILVCLEEDVASAVKQPGFAETGSLIPWTALEYMGSTKMAELVPLATAAGDFGILLKSDASPCHIEQESRLLPHVGRLKFEIEYTTGEGVLPGDLYFRGKFFDPERKEVGQAFAVSLPAGAGPEGFAQYQNEVSVPENAEILVTSFSLASGGMSAAREVVIRKVSALPAGVQGPGILLGVPPSADWGVFPAGAEPEWNIFLFQSGDSMTAVFPKANSQGFFLEGCPVQLPEVVLILSRRLAFVPVNAQTMGRTGFYSLSVSVHSADGSPPDETLTSAVVAARLEKPDPFFSFSVFDRIPPMVARSINSGSLPIFSSWGRIERSKGVYDFSVIDQEVSDVEKAGLEPFGMILLSFEPDNARMPAWLAGEYPALVEKDYRAAPDSFYVQEAAFAAALTRRYAGRLKDYSLVQEIDLYNGIGIEDHYVKQCQTIAKAMREEVEDLVILGIGVSGEDLRKGLPMAKRLWERLWESLDGIGLDAYVNPKTFGPGSHVLGDEQGQLREKLLDLFALIRAKGKSHLSIDEKGYNILSSELVDSAYSRDLASFIARSLLVARSVPGLGRYLYFKSTDNFPEGGAVYGMWKKGIPRPSVAAYATVANKLAFAVNPVKIDLHDDVWCLVFEKGSGSVAALWSVGEGDSLMRCGLPPEVQISDLMGNRIAHSTPDREGMVGVPFGSSPIFLESVAEASQLADILRQGKVAIPPFRLFVRRSPGGTIELVAANRSREGEAAKFSVKSASGHLLAEWNRRVAGGRTEVLRSPSFAGYLPDDLTVTAGADGKGFRQTQEVDLTVFSIPHADRSLSLNGAVFNSGATPQFHLREASDIFPSGGDAMSNKLWLGPEDFQAKIWMEWNSSGLYLAVSVEDPIHVESPGGSKLWIGDSVQVGLDLGGDAVPAAFSEQVGYDNINDFEFAIGLVKGRAETFCYQAPVSSVIKEGQSLPSGITTVIERDEVAKETHYQIMIPWTFVLRHAPQAGKVFGVNVNIFNGLSAEIPMPRFWMAMSPGVAGGKNPAFFKKAVLSPSSR
jgi:hypothetical protein